MQPLNPGQGLHNVTGNDNIQ